MIDIAKNLGVNRSLVTRNVKSMLKAGLVTVRSINGRTKSVMITEKGRAVSMGVCRDFKDITDVYLGGISFEERETLVSIAEKIDSGVS